MSVSMFYPNLVWIKSDDSSINVNYVTLLRTNPFGFLLRYVN